MVEYFIGVYIINRTSHGRLEIRNLSSRVEKIFQHSKRNLVSPRGHANTLYIFIFFSKLSNGQNPTKSCNLVGSESGRYFTIVPANPAGRNRWQLHSQVCLLFVKEQKLSFSNHFSLKTCAIISTS